MEICATSHAAEMMPLCDFGIVTGDFGQNPKSVSIDRNGRSRYNGISGHGRPKWLVTWARNTHEALLGLFGLVPHWAKEATFGRRTYNARSETVHEKPTFRDAWRKGQHCIIPAAAIYEPDWRSGKAKATRIRREDGKPMGIAGLWADCTLPSGEKIYSFTMLTLNADDHAFMRNFHKPDDEKRIVAILHEDQYDAWLEAKPNNRMDFIKQYPAEQLIATN